MPSNRESSHWWPDLPLAFPPATPEFLHCIDLCRYLELAFSKSSFRVLLLMNQEFPNRSWPQSRRCWPRFQHRTPLPSAPCAESLEACSRERARVVATLEESNPVDLLPPPPIQGFLHCSLHLLLVASSSYSSATPRSECCA